MKHANSVWRLFLCGTIAFMSGCSSAENEPAEPGKTDGNENVTAIDRAIEEALGMIHSVEGATTRADERRIESVTPILRHVTRSLDDCGSEVETDGGNWYVVNYADSKGFSIVTDADVPCKVFGFSDTGRFSLDEADLNPALKRYLDILVTHGIETYGYAYGDGGPVLPPGAIPVDSIIGGGGRVPFPDNPSLPIDLPSHGPLLTSKMQKWYQGSPFNTCINALLGRDVKVGCTAIACGLIITHHGWPYSYGPNIYDYPSMRNLEYHEHIGMLLAELGTPYNLNITYGEQSSGASASNFPRTFHHFDYLCPDALSTFTRDKVTSNIGARRPVLVSGYNSSGVGHAWVVDGYYIKDLRDLAWDSSSRYVYYFHNVWGWRYGTANGYYQMNTSVEYSDTGISGVYYDLKILADIRPNK